MKIDSSKNFYGTAGDMIFFTGSGSVDGTDTAVEQSWPLAGALFFKGTDINGFVVNVKTVVGSTVIPLGTITNQSGWTNDQAGLDACIDDLLAWQAEATPGSSEAIKAVDSNIYPYAFDNTHTYYNEDRTIQRIDFYSGSTGKFTWSYTYNEAGDVETFTVADFVAE